MAEEQFNTARALLIPGYIQSLNNIAEEQGLAVSSRAADEEITVEWVGSPDQFRATNFFAKCAPFPKSRRGSIWCNWLREDLDALSIGDGQHKVTYSIPVPESIDLKNGVEVVIFGEGHALFHGHNAQLLSEGIVFAHQLPKKNVKTGVFDDATHWMSAKHPDGKTIYEKRHFAGRAPVREQRSAGNVIYATFPRAKLNVGGDAEALAKFLDTL